jgi:plastocyanin
MSCHANAGLAATMFGPKLLLLGITLALAISFAYAQSAGPPTAPSLASIDWSKSELVTVTMADYDFSPQRLVFRIGVPTRLRLVNNGSQIHDFTTPDFFKTIDLRDPGVMGSSGIGISVNPHDHKDVEFIARLSGQFGLICADHDWAGMRADIFVK